MAGRPRDPRKDRTRFNELAIECVEEWKSKTGKGLKDFARACGVTEWAIQGACQKRGAASHELAMAIADVAGLRPRKRRELEVAWFEDVIGKGHHGVLMQRLLDIVKGFLKGKESRDEDAIMDDLMAAYRASAAKARGRAKSKAKTGNR